ITHRIAHAVASGTHSASNGLAVTFTNRAAGEMRGRLAQLGVPSVSVRTFHAAALSQLRYFWPGTVGGQFPDLAPSKAGMVGQACRELGIRSAKPLVRDLAAEIEWAGSSLVSVGDYPAAAAAAGRTPVGAGSEVIDLPGVAQVMSAYQDVKARAHAIDFEDVLLSMVALLGDRPDVADEVRRHYRWFTVDEYQDITPAQDRLLSAWLGERDDVCVVGDASQTIYSFAGASPDALGQFARRWPNATEVRLDRCYRCSPQIVTAANAVIRAAAPRAATDVSGRGSARHGAGGPVGLPAAVLLRSQRPPGPVPEIVGCADDADEAAAVATRIQDLLASGAAARDIAILMRTNAASEPVEAALAEAGIPYVMRGAERFFDRPEVREAVTRMRGHAVAGGDRRGDVPVEQELPGADVNGLVEQVRAVLAGMGWQSGGPASGGATRERWESLAAVLALAQEVAASGRTTMSELVAEFERRAHLSHAPTADGVTMATLHAAKGLEWDSVFIVGAAEGSLPIIYADTEARIEEERRLFYVGLTRARDRLVVTWAMTRSNRPRSASRFLADMRARGQVSTQATPSGLVRQGRSGAKKDRRRQPPGRCRVCDAGLVTGAERTLGRCRTCPGSADEHLVEQLRAWRGATAKQRSVPAYIVFTDVTLSALAERKPASTDDLLDIPGIGPAKAELYGEELLALLSAEPDSRDADTPEVLGL
ncbi:MAG: ATP-dependent DNA helicase UvrD2, partial [Candidatus Nanopelagicales bacterium]